MNSALTKMVLALSLSSSCPSTSSLLLSSSFFHRNSKASTSSRHISLLPTVTWHCRPDPPSARMVSTTVSKSFFFITPSTAFSHELCEKASNAYILQWLKRTCCISRQNHQREQTADITLHVCTLCSGMSVFMYTKWIMEAVSVSTWSPLSVFESSKT